MKKAYVIVCTSVFLLLIPCGVLGVLKNSASPIKTISYQMAIYDFPGSKRDSKAIAEKILKSDYPHFKVVKNISAEVSGPEIVLYSVSEVKKQYPVLDLRSIGYFGRGLTRKQAEQIQLSDHVLILNIAYPSKNAWQYHFDTQRFLSQVAQHVNGLMWDEETREIFTIPAWEKQRNYDISEGIPRIENHTIIHAYKDEDDVRAVSLGMAKFGLPDVVVNNFSWSLNRNMGHLINIALQSLAEGLSPNRDNILIVDIENIKNKKIKNRLIATLLPNAKKTAHIPVRLVKPEEGDPNNRILELVFQDSNEKSRYERQAEMITALFGSEESITYANHDDRILQASKKAKAKLPQLMAAFNQGLKPGEYIQVKAAFATPDGGREFMWVEVKSWQAGRIKGLLRNEPFNIPTLNVGAEVDVAQEDVFDFIRYYADGTTEGNETGKLIQQSGSY